jgi:hypothetical protein
MSNVKDTLHRGGDLFSVLRRFEPDESSRVYPIAVHLRSFRVKMAHRETQK